MKNMFFALVLSALLNNAASAQFLAPPEPPGSGGGDLEPLTPPLGPAVDQPVVVLPPPPTQVGNPSVVDGGPGTIVLTNRGHIISEPVDTDDLNINVTLEFPTAVQVDVVYRDYIDIVIAATGDDGLQQNRPWAVLEPHTVIVRVFHANIHVYEIGPDTDGDGVLEQTSIGQSPINTGEGNLPLEVDILIHDGVIDVETGGNGGAGGDPVVVDLPPGTNTSGNVVIYNRETVAGVTFEAEISDLSVNGTDPLPPLVP